MIIGLKKGRSDVFIFLLQNTSTAEETSQTHRTNDDPRDAAPLNVSPSDSRKRVNAAAQPFVAPGAHHNLTAAATADSTEVNNSDFDDLEGIHFPGDAEDMNRDSCSDIRLIQTKNLPISTEYYQADRSTFEQESGKESSGAVNNKTVKRSLSKEFASHNQKHSARAAATFGVRSQWEEPSVLVGTFFVRMYLLLKLQDRLKSPHDETGMAGSLINVIHAPKRLILVLKGSYNMMRKSRLTICAGLC